MYVHMYLYIIIKNNLYFKYFWFNEKTSLSWQGILIRQNVKTQSLKIVHNFYLFVFFVFLIIFAQVFYMYIGITLLVWGSKCSISICCCCHIPVICFDSFFFVFVFVLSKIFIANLCITVLCCTILCCVS